ncbi:MAG: BREX-1 system phosphatase PglZ type A [Vagococcus sp.]|uniref:BREX-1 system phosphatase PglZ type A n=1 Tax=Vagococcus TaxID=2737 RepID=UPI002FC9EE52
MSDLNLNQIENKLNELFLTYGERKLIFWFDPKGEFEDDINNELIKLENAQIKKIGFNTQFITKRFFEIEDTTNNYLVYAPFERIDDDDENNHLLSIVKYSELFNADRISLIMEQLDIIPELHEIMTDYSKFFGAKSRISSFEKMTTTSVKTKEVLELTIMSVLTKANTNQFYSILQSILIEFSKGSNILFSQLNAYELEEVFWKYVYKYYGYKSEDPTIQKLVISFFLNTYFGQLGIQELPNSFKEYEVLDQTTAIVSFMDGVMNDTRYKEHFNQLSHQIYQVINGDKLLDKASVEELIEADIFESIHLKILSYYSNQLISGDTTPMVSSMPLVDVVTRKMRSNFGDKYIRQYNALINAQKLLMFTYSTHMDKFNLILKDYEENSYKVDQYYRKFIWNLDHFEMDDAFFELYQIVEKKYKEFLDESSHLWNDYIMFDNQETLLDFYNNYACHKMKTVVIISDAFRYEAAKEIQKEIQNEKKYSTKMESILTVLPSVTEFGKSASLLGKGETFEYVNGVDVEVNSMKTKGTVARDKILKAKNPNSLAISYEDVVEKDNAKELRELFNGQDMIYLYHDQIDKTGDHGQERQVFEAVDKTIKELKTLLPRISNGANIYRFIITSDHGFIYTRSKIEEYDKIDNPSISISDRVERRFIISENQYKNIGISSMKLSDALRNDDKRIIHFPSTSAIFKKSGGGQNYVHGGSSPQEMIVPVLEIMVGRGSSVKEPAQVQLMSNNKKIIGLSKSLEFYQLEAVNDSVIKENYSLHFEDKKGRLISNVHSYYADSKSTSASERFTNFTFDFINRNYDTNEKVFLILKNANTQIEIERIEFLIDNPFAGDHNFDI